MVPLARTTLCVCDRNLWAHPTGFVGDAAEIVAQRGLRQPFAVLVVRAVVGIERDPDLVEELFGHRDQPGCPLGLALGGGNVSQAEKAVG